MSNTVKSSAFVSSYTSKRGPAFTVGGLTRAELDAVVASPVGRKLGLAIKLQRFDGAQAAKPVAAASKTSSRKVTSKVSK